MLLPACATMLIPIHLDGGAQLIRWISMATTSRIKGCSSITKTTCQF
jgi:hypothetical protein